jgi:guanylate kinase
MTGKAIIFSAPSGSGKTTIVHHLLKTRTDLSFSISATTRPPRGKEQDGKDYYFLSLQDFEQKKLNEELLEWEEVYHGIFYGTLRKEIERIWENGQHVIFDVDVKGGLKLKKKLKERALAVFVQVPDLIQLENRLRSRKTESEEDIQKRVEKAAREIEFAPEFDKVLHNDDLDRSLQQAEKLVSEFINA